ncbi:MAG: MCE family protein [Actinomycetota bacterium]
MPRRQRTITGPLRTGVLGIALVACLVLVSFGYTGLPFYPQGKTYTAYFLNAAGITPGNDVQIYGYPVGEVKTVQLVNRSAQVQFTVDRDVAVGDQSLVAIKTDTVLGQRALVVTPRGAGSVTTIPLGRTTTPYTLNNALQDLGRNVGDLDKATFVEALQTLTDTMHDATPQLRNALTGITELSRTVNVRDEEIGELLTHARSVSTALATRSEQINKLITDGNQLFAALDGQRQAIKSLVTGIEGVSRQISGFVADNRREFGPALQKLNLVLDNLNQRREHIGAALERLPGYATALGEVVGSAPGFQANIYGVPEPTLSAALLDTYFQPGKLPDALADMLRGFTSERTVIRPKSP